MIGLGVMMSNSSPRGKMEVDGLDRIGQWQMEWNLRVRVKTQLSEVNWWSR